MKKKELIAWVYNGVVIPGHELLNGSYRKTQMARRTSYTSVWDGPNYGNEFERRFGRRESPMAVHSD